MPDSSVSGLGARQSEDIQELLAHQDEKDRSVGLGHIGKRLHDEIFAREGISLPDATIKAALAECDPQDLVNVTMERDMLLDLLRQACSVAEDWIDSEADDHQSRYIRAAHEHIDRIRRQGLGRLEADAGNPTSASALTPPAATPDAASPQSPHED